MVTREAADRRIATLQEKHGTAPIEHEQNVVPSDEFPALLADQGDEYIGGAYAWTVRKPGDAAQVTDSFYGDPGDSNRVLFHLPRGSNTWGLPGGGQEDDETFEQTVVREVKEETGIDCDPTDLWLLRRIEWVSDDETDDRRTYSVHPFFNAEYTSGSISVQAGESNGAAWFAELPPTDQLHPANQRRAASWNP